MHCETAAGELQMEQAAAAYIVTSPKLANVFFTVPLLARCIICEWHKISFAVKRIILWEIFVFCEL